MNQPPHPGHDPRGLPESIVRELAALLAGMLAAHEEYLGLLHEHRAAIRAARPSLAAEAAERQTRALERIAMLEQTRRDLVQRVLEAGLWPDRALITLSGLAERAGPMRGPLLETAQRLREAIAKVQLEQGVLVRVARSLSGHIEGLMRHVAKAASHAGTYGRRGVVGHAAVMTALDVRS